MSSEFDICLGWAIEWLEWIEVWDVDMIVRLGLVDDQLKDMARCSIQSC